MSIDNTSTPPPTEPVVAAPGAPAAPKDYEALYQQEVRERIAEREKYKPFTQTFGRLDPASQQAIQALAAAAADGDTDAIAQWSASTYRNLTGSEIAAQVAAAQTGQAPAAPLGGEPPAQAPVAPAGLTAEQVADMVARQISMADMARQITAELNGAGFTPESPGGRAIIAYAQQTKLPIADAVAWYNADVIAQYNRITAAGAQVVGQTPPPAPGGAPAAGTSGATPRERALSRLQGG